MYPSQHAPSDDLVVFVPIESRERIPAPSHEDRDHRMAVQVVYMALDLQASRQEPEADW